MAIALKMWILCPIKPLFKLLKLHEIAQRTNLRKMLPRGAQFFFRKMHPILIAKHDFQAIKKTARENIEK